MIDISKLMLLRIYNCCYAPSI